jgi:hypothetical protein
MQTTLHNMQTIIIYIIINIIINIIKKKLKIKKKKDECIFDV